MWLSLRLFICAVLLLPAHSTAIAGWTKCAGPDGTGSGGIWSFLQFKGSLFVGTAGGGLFRSEDGGTHWKIVTCCDSFAFPMSLAAIGDTIYVGTAWGGVYRSCDGGLTWSQQGMNGQYVGTLVASGNHLFAGTEKGVFRSTDAGASWDSITNQYSYNSTTGIAVHAGKIYLLSGYLTTDEGRTWAEFTRHWLSFDPADIVATDSGVFIAADSVYRSTDDGQHWTPVNPPLRPGYKVIALASWKDTLYCASDVVYRSVDAGKHWTPLGLQTQGSPFFRLLVNDESCFAATNNDGLFRSTDHGTTWADASNGLACADIDFLFTHDSMLVAEIRGQGVRFSTDQGDHWSHDSAFFPRNTLSALAGAGALLTASVDSGGVFVSTNDGKSWSLRDSGLIGPIAWLGMTTTSIFAGSPYGIFRSLDSGLHWSRAEENACDTQFIGIDNKIDTVVTRPSGPFASLGSTVLLAGPSRGVYLSTNDGDHWIRPNGNDNNFYVNALATIGDTVFAGADNGVYRATGGISPWVLVDSTLTGSITGLVPNGQTLFAAEFDGQGVSVSGDGGHTWKNANAGLGNQTVRTIASDGRFLYVHPNGGSLWRRPLSEMITSVHYQRSEDPVSPAILLSANPNPARDELLVRYSAGDANTEICLFNILGERMISAQGNNSKEQTLNVKSLRPGLYLLTLRDYMKSATRTVMIVR